MWWTTVKGARRAKRRPWRWRDPASRPVKMTRDEFVERMEEQASSGKVKIYVPERQR